MIRFDSKRLGSGAAVALLTGCLVACAGGSRDSGGAPPPAGGETVETALQHADSAFKDGDYTEAQKGYEEALRIVPDHPRAIVGLGTCGLKNRQVKRAHDLLVDHLSRHPENTAARLVLARTLVRQAEFPEAAAQLRTVLESDPDNLMAHYNLGFIAYRSHDYDTAMQHLQKTLALRPDHPEAHYTLGLTEMATGKYDDAVTEFEKAIAIDPRHVGAHFNLAAAAARAGRNDLAEKERRAYADLSGRSKADAEESAQVKAASLKAVEALMAERYEEALAEYQTLLAAHPQYAPLYNDIGRVQLKLGRRTEALESLKQAVTLDPTLSEPHYLLSNLYHQMGDDAASTRERATFAALETIPEGKSAY
ncbi:MAG TPA: tetratricopeptide repeat protein [Dongiaceae bacterium]|nr:tetratricopeptide repeat protein [Dongiaceae bacterium]